MSRLTPPVGPRDHVQGNPGAPLQLVEYGDFECPFCGRAYFVVKTLQQALGDALCFVFRNFPVGTVHPHAVRAAQAAEAAALQDSFWQMHDMLFEHQGALEDRDLVGYAAAIGLDVGRFEHDLCPRVRRRDDQEVVLARVRHVREVPAIGVELGAQTGDRLRASIPLQHEHHFAVANDVAAPAIRGNARMGLAVERAA